ncbi:MAG: hypothetical protein K0B37_05185 [Bacteroidales bacterium]|nr:hypothetical protein [Bacteroidales bacterium]
MSEPEKPADENVVPSETFHFHEPWVIVPDEDTTESIDLKEEDETEFHIPGIGFRWPELIPQSEDEEDHDFHTNDVPSER